jgi:hypothetical protein
VSTASLYCSDHVQRLRVWGIAPHALESFGLDPWALRPERLRWLKRWRLSHWNKSEAGAKIAAFLVREQGLPALSSMAFSHCAYLQNSKCSNELKAEAEASLAFFRWLR